ncbi:MAG: hypothetical protein HC927_08340 [Deltaproteobacteria bacterium]|nr:hypothetical protein [Deltaproteobacteria bacterium]
MIDADALWTQIQQRVDRWIDSKGCRYEQEGIMRVRYQDGRVADLRIVSINVDDKSLLSWSLKEPTDGGLFATTLQVARGQNVVAVACELAAGAPAQVVAPVNFDPWCPAVLRDIIDLDVQWSVGDMVVTSRPLRCDGADGGANLAEVISSESRSLPLVVVSESERFVLHPNIAEEIAHDLSGLAIVAVVTDSAAWGVTNALGVDWSCYNGAIRLYWPLHAVSRTPFRHPLWTERRLLYDVADTREAAKRIRRQFRRKILGLSTLTMHRHPVFDEVERADRHRAVKTRREEAADQELLDLYEKENERLELELAELRGRVAGLKTDLANAEAMLKWAPRDTEDEVSPVYSMPPESVAQAVEWAKRMYAELLIFGDDVPDGVKKLSEDAGPPDKILEYLGGLAKLAEALRSGPLAATHVQWLKTRNYAASNESDTIRKNRVEMQKRTWHDGHARREFDLHLKPNEATSPDRCVRIYFDWDDEAKKVIVGWVGRHP